MPILEIVPDNFYYDYECKYSKGKSKYIVPAKINNNTIEKLQYYSMKIFNLLDCQNYARVDFRLSKENEIYFRYVKKSIYNKKKLLKKKKKHDNPFSVLDNINFN